MHVIPAIIGKSRVDRMLSELVAGDRGRIVQRDTMGTPQDCVIACYHSELGIDYCVDVARAKAFVAGVMESSPSARLATNAKSRAIDPGVGDRCLEQRKRFFEIVECVHQFYLRQNAHIHRAAVSELTIEKPRGPAAPVECVVTRIGPLSK